jgi:hypothetical protein
MPVGAREILVDLLRFFAGLLEQTLTLQEGSLIRCSPAQSPRR